MLIGEMIISSLEYPEKMSLVIFTGGCDLRCPYCHNPEIIDGGKPVELAYIINEIENSMEFIDSVVITGGEPLKQCEDVEKILRYSKERELKTKLDTNGCYPERLKKIIKLVDYVALDVKAPFEKYNEIIGCSIGDKVKKSMELCIKQGVYLECRTTYVPYLMEIEDILEIAKNVTADIYTLQQFRDKKVLDEKLYGTHSPSRDELEKIANIIKPFQKKIKIKTAEFGSEIIK
ncbi:anaerobic ribonucleoside-triphosphate reductase activating protein [Methanobacterium sp. ACI-7]|uniref:anaerobic ribonucleoside-triphosphate reductase activating protein n=1 Tax=unclassified Methanobacterium TaxID=2627676 RepID=UPI0039C3D17E